MASIVVILNSYEEEKKELITTIFELFWIETRIYSRQNKDTMNGYGLINKLAAYSHFSVVIQYCTILIMIKCISNVLDQPVCDTCVRSECYA